MVGSDSSPLGGSRVLYVDESAQAREAVEAALAADVTAVESAASAREALAEAAFDCVVSEYDLPSTDSTDGGALGFCEHVDAVAPGTPFVLYTDAGNERVAGRAVAAGAAGYVSKSEGEGVLADRIAALLSDESAYVERALTASEPAEVVEEAPLALIESDADGVIVGWNSGATDLFGYTAEEALGKDSVELLVPASIKEEIERVQEETLTRVVDTKNVNENVRKNGSRITCEWHNTTLTDENGEIRGSLAFVHDVTAREQRKETIDQLRAVTRELVRADDRETVARRVVEAAEDILEQPISVVYFANDDGELEVAASTSSTEELPPVVAGESVNWRAYADGETKVVASNVEDVSTVEPDHPIESVLVHPLGEHGTLSLGSPTEDAFDETDVQLSNILASATTAALDRTSRERDLRLHETIVDAVGAGVFALDGDGYLETANETMVELTGYDHDELVGMHATDLIDDETYEEATERIRTVTSGDPSFGHVMTFELELESATGTQIPCEVNVGLLPDGVEYGGVAGVVRDVRERKRIRSELGEKRRKIENLHDIASQLDDCESSEDVWRITVEAAEGILDFDVCAIDEVRGEYLHCIELSSEIEPDGYQERAHVSKTIAGKAHLSGESFLSDDVQNDEEATPVQGSYRSLVVVPVGDKGVFQAISDEVGVFDEDDLELAELLMRHVGDALERIEFEDELRSERDRFAALFENVPDPVVQSTYSDEGAIVESINPAFERAFGYGPEDILGEDLNEFIVPVDRRDEAEAIDARGLEGHVIEREVKRRTTDGLRDFQLTAVPVDAEGEEPATYGVYSDITERKERQKRVEILNRVLRHDLRNGMNIIKGSAEMLQDAVSDTTAVGYADQVIERADDLLGLAEKTRAVERTLDRDSEATGPVDVCESVESSAARIRSEYPRATIGMDLPDDVQVRADDMLRAAIYHVMENAVQHNDNEQPHVEVTAKQVSDREDTLSIEVSDDGPGIPDAERELIQEEREITQLRHASGLGLWLVDWVVNQSGGEVTFEPNDPRGTVVTLSVPLATESDTLPTDD